MKVNIVNGQAYDTYHHTIAKAEEQYFVQNEVDSSLFYFQKCFDTFDFIFARDAINALQIAYKENRPIEYFLKKSFESGVTPSIISTIPALKEFASDSLPKFNAMRHFAQYRSHYLKRINIDCLNQIYTLGIIDQITKYKDGANETGPLFKLATIYGLPGEKNCGIEELGINEELGVEKTDFLNIRDSISVRYNKELRYFSLNDNSLIMHLPMVIMLHNYCTYKEYEDALREAYMGGFIYSREIGCIYDNSYRGEASECLMIPNEGIFGLNKFLKTSKVDSNKANRLRAKWGICTIEADTKKKELEKLEYKFIWEYW